MYINIPTLNRLYSWYGKTTVRLVLTIIAALLVGAVFLGLKPSPTDTPAVSLPTVRVAMAGSQNTDASISLIGTVKAVSQADIQTEVAGRIVSVRVQAGDSVTAGQIIATQENASEQAVVLQAEGAYEAAIASAAQSTIGVDQALTNLSSARISAISTIRSTYTSNDNIIQTVVDDLFATDANDVTIGFRLDSNGQAPGLVSERNNLTNLMTSWGDTVETLNLNSDIVSALSIAADNSLRIKEFIDQINSILVDATPVGSINATTLSSLRSSVQSARGTLDTNLSSLVASRIGIQNAEEALQKAEIGGSGNVVSSADAQVKQALGSLRAAQANLAKTILRSPIRGTVNTLSVDTGDFVGGFTPIAEVANNDALIITTFVGESDRNRIAVNDTVMIEGGISGIVVSIAPAVDAATKKIEVRIAADSQTLKSGDTVSITLENSSPDPENTGTTFFVPITSVKFTETDGIVFSVDDNTLVSHPVEIGEVRGSYVEILSGISADTEIVIDARGRAAGQKVEALKN